MAFVIKSPVNVTTAGSGRSELGKGLLYVCLCERVSMKNAVCVNTWALCWLQCAPGQFSNDDELLRKPFSSSSPERGSGCKLWVCPDPLVLCDFFGGGGEGGWEGETFLPHAAGGQSSLLRTCFYYMACGFTL